MNWYIKCITNYVNFSGRASRSEYWIFLLFNILILLFLGTASGYMNSLLSVNFFTFLLPLYLLFIIIPHLAVVVRRLHDINKSGTYWFIRFIPFIGAIWLLILLVEDSHEGPNKWGNNPKGIGNYDEIDQIGMDIKF